MSQHTTNQPNTWIAVAEDCKATAGEAPPRKEPQTAAQIEFEMLLDHPYHFTSDDVLYAANGCRRGMSREEFFSKGQPCFRSSALCKRYGWGVHSNEECKIAIYAVGSAEYQRLSQDKSIKQLTAMRSKKQSFLT